MKFSIVTLVSVLCCTVASCSTVKQPPKILDESNMQSNQSGSFVNPPVVVDKDDGDVLSPILAESCNVVEAINWMAQQRIIYTQSPADEWRDCSGNFLRLSSYIASNCSGVEMPAPPGIGEYVHGSGNNKRPGVAQARTTRGLAKWYDQKGLFTPIYYDGTDVEHAPVALQEVRNQIKPGTVLWFSRRKPQASGGKESLYDEATGIINHMGTVASVTKDEQGNVIDWTMYHGQNERKHNGITDHWWNWPTAYTSGGKKYPPGGYWSQRIVGFAESLIPSGTIQLSDSSN